MPVPCQLLESAAMPATARPPDPTDDSSSLFARRPYVLFLAGRFLGTLATGSQSVVIAWEVYELARQTMSLAEAAFAVGMIGLAQFLPLFALTLIAGETADRHDRRRILTLCYLAQLLISAGLAFRSALGGGLWPIFALAGPVRLRPGVLPADGQRPRPDAGAAPIASAGDRDQFAGRPTGQHPRPGPRRVALRRVAGPRLRGQCRSLRRRRVLRPADSRRHPAADRGGPVAGRPDPGRAGVPVGKQAGARGHLPRPVRRAARRRDRLAPGVRPGRARGRPAGVRHPARVPGGRGPHGRRVSGTTGRSARARA